MKPSESIIESLLAKTEVYGKTSIELFKLKALDQLSTYMSSIASRLAVISIFSLFIIILNLGIALLIGEMLGKLYYGFFILAAFYFLVTILLYVFLEKWIKEPVANWIIGLVLNKQNQ
jgi:Zn-dependent protease with chaperone function